MPRVEGADISIQDFLEESTSFPRSHLQQGFENMSILLIGVTSFIGSMILEKLLRSCPEIDNIYLLVRSKDGKEPPERMNDLFMSPLFDRLKTENPAATNKIKIVPCDLYKNDLGISNDDYLTLITEVNAVIHTARLIGTNVRFKEAVSINLKALQNILKLWQRMKKLDAVTYVSSLFAHSDKQIVEEKIYPSSINGYCLINMSENLPEDILDAITSGIKGDYPDISLFTLAMAENILNEKGEGLPLCIIRPSFVVATYNEPISGWIQKQRQESPTDVLLNVLLGKLFTIHYNGRQQAEAVPVDIVANLIIAATGQLLLKRKEWVNQAVITHSHVKKNAYTKCDLKNIQIYNIFSYNKQKVTWSEYFNKNIKYEQEVPFFDTIGYPTLQINTYWLVHWIMTWLGIGKVLLHNTEKGITGIESGFLETVKRLQNNSNTVLSFCKNFRLLKDDNVINLWESMSISDRSYFDFNLKSINWNHFFYTQCRGLRVYIMKDPLVTVPDAQIKRQRWKSLQSMFISLLTISVCCAIYYLKIDIN